MELISSNVVTMSSKEIAELTGKEHCHVLRDVKDLVNKLKAHDPNLDHNAYQIVRDNRNYVSEAFLNKDLTITLVAGYDVVVRYKIVKRWQELEDATKEPLTLAEITVIHAQRLVSIEREQKRLAEQQARVTAEHTIVKAQLDALIQGENFMTIVGYANLKKQRIDSPTASRYGKAASKYCREHGITTGEANHPLYGACRTYPVEVLESVLPF